MRSVSKRRTRRPRTRDMASSSQLRDRKLRGWFMPR